MERDGVSEIKGAGGWSYSAFHHGQERGPLAVELLRDDGTSVQFTVPDFVNDPEDIRRVALVVIGALQKWEDVEGLGG